MVLPYRSNGKLLPALHLLLNKAMQLAHLLLQRPHGRRIGQKKIQQVTLA